MLRPEVISAQDTESIPNRRPCFLRTQVVQPEAIMCFVLIPAQNSELIPPTEAYASLCTRTYDQATGAQAGHL